MNNLLENQYVSTTLAVFLVLYGGLAAPRLPSGFANLFTNPFFRMSVIFLIAYTSSKNHSIALISTITLVLLMQSSEEQVLINDESEYSVNVDRKNRRKHRNWHNMMDEEFAKGDNKNHLLKKALVNEDQIINAVINSELDTLQSNDVNSDIVAEVVSNDSNLQTEIVNVEEELRKEPNVVQENAGIPGPLDSSKLANLQDLQTTETPVKDQIVKTKKAVVKESNVKSTRGLNEAPSRCASCEYHKNDNYNIDTNDIILPYSQNGFYNFNNM